MGLLPTSQGGVLKTELELEATDHIWMESGEAPNGVSGESGK